MTDEVSFGDTPRNHGKTPLAEKRCVCVWVATSCGFFRRVDITRNWGRLLHPMICHHKSLRTHTYTHNTPHNPTYQPCQTSSLSLHTHTPTHTHATYRLSRNCRRLSQLMCRAPWKNLAISIASSATRSFSSRYRIPFAKTETCQSNPVLK